MPEPDPILEELHAVRDALAQESGHDLERIADAARARQKKSGRDSVRLPPRRPGSTKKAS
jgi:hypothetical protein